jgi:hypothetical protein
MNDGKDRSDPKRPRNRGATRTFTLLIGVLVLAIMGARGVVAAEPDDISGPDVTIIEDDDRTILEYRQGGVLRMVRIVPDWGKPYYLVPRDRTAGHEDLERAETLLPSWVIIEF